MWYLRFWYCIDTSGNHNRCTKPKNLHKILQFTVKMLLRGRGLTAWSRSQEELRPLIMAFNLSWDPTVSRLHLTFSGRPPQAYWARSPTKAQKAATAKWGKMAAPRVKTFLTDPTGFPEAPRQGHSGGNPLGPRGGRHHFPANGIQPHAVTDHPAISQTRWYGKREREISFLPWSHLEHTVQYWVPALKWDIRKWKKSEEGQLNW